MKNKRLKRIILYILFIGLFLFIIPIPVKVNVSYRGIYCNQEKEADILGNVEIKGWQFHYFFRSDTFRGKVNIILDNGKIYNSGKMKATIDNKGVFSPRLEGEYRFLMWKERMGGSVEGLDRIISRNFNNTIEYIITGNYEQIIIPEMGSDQEGNGRMIAYFVAPAESKEEAMEKITELYDKNPSWPFDYIY